MAILYVLSFAAAVVITFVDTLILLPETSMNVMGWSVGYFALLYSIAFLLGSVSAIFKEKYAGKLWDKDIEMNPYIKLWRCVNLGGVAVVIFCIANSFRGITTYIIATVQTVIMKGCGESPYLLVQLLLIVASVLAFAWGFGAAKGLLMYLGRRNATLMNIKDMPIFEDIDSDISGAKAVGIKDDKIVLEMKDGENKEYVYYNYGLENIYAFGTDGHPDKHKNNKTELLALYFEARYNGFKYQHTLCRYFPFFLGSSDRVVTLKRK